MKKKTGKKQSRRWTEDYSCACCDLFWPEWAEQQVALNKDDADAVYQDLREMMREGFARYAYPLLGRLIELEPNSPRLRRISQLRIVQLSDKGRGAFDKSDLLGVGSLA